jgi:hypothetical protein
MIDVNSCTVGASVSIFIQSRMIFQRTCQYSILYEQCAAYDRCRLRFRMFVVQLILSKVLELSASVAPSECGKVLPKLFPSCQMPACTWCLFGDNGLKNYDMSKSQWTHRCSTICRLLLQKLSCKIMAHSGGEYTWISLFFSLLARWENSHDLQEHQHCQLSYQYCLTPYNCEKCKYV